MIAGMRPFAFEILNVATSCTSWLMTVTARQNLQHDQAIGIAEPVHRIGEQKELLEIRRTLRRTARHAACKTTM
jgi:hypothetical protein